MTDEVLEHQDADEDEEGTLHVRHLVEQRVAEEQRQRLVRQRDEERGRVEGQDLEHK